MVKVVRISVFTIAFQVVGDNKDALTQSLEHTRTMLEGVMAMPNFSAVAEDVINRYRRYFLQIKPPMHI